MFLFVSSYSFYVSLIISIASDFLDVPLQLDEFERNERKRKRKRLFFLATTFALPPLILFFFCIFRCSTFSTFNVVESFFVFIPMSFHFCDSNIQQFEHQRKNSIDLQRPTNSLKIERIRLNTIRIEQEDEKKNPYLFLLQIIIIIFHSFFLFSFQFPFHFHPITIEIVYVFVVCCVIFHPSFEKPSSSSLQRLTYYDL